MAINYGYEDHGYYSVDNIGVFKRKGIVQESFLFNLIF